MLRTLFACFIALAVVVASNTADAQIFRGRFNAQSGYGYASSANSGSCGCTQSGQQYSAQQDYYQSQPGYYQQQYAGQQTPPRRFQNARQQYSQQQNAQRQQYYGQQQQRYRAQQQQYAQQYRQPTLAPAPAQPTRANVRVPGSAPVVEGSVVENRPVANAGISAVGNDGAVVTSNGIVLEGAGGLQAATFEAPIDNTPIEIQPPMTETNSTVLPNSNSNPVLAPPENSNPGDDSGATSILEKIE